MLLDLIRRLFGRIVPPAEHLSASEVKIKDRRLFSVPKRYKIKKTPENIVSTYKPYAMARYFSDTTGAEAGYRDGRVGGEVAKLRRYGLPEFDTPEALASWLKLPLKTVAWLSDYHGNNMYERQSKKRHYRYVWIPKRGTPGKYRLLEIPKPMLRYCQQRILREILDRVPAHPAAHGFVKGRSILTNAQLHADRQIVVKCDLSNFYPGIYIKRVIGLFRSFGYNLEIAHWLARLCTNRFADLKPPADMVCDMPMEGRHLPQGAPTSPAIANLCAWALDVRLTGLARKFESTYTRYADDLTFSSSGALAHRGRVARLLRLIKGIVRNERFRFHCEKTRVVRKGKRQRVTGLVVNEKPNIDRREFDRLKAILYNCVKHGPASQNRAGIDNFAAHLGGRIAFVASINPEKSECLKRLYERINWT